MSERGLMSPTVRYNYPDADRGTGMTCDPVWWDDEMLLAMLHVVFEQTDPVPDAVVAAARSVFELRSAGIASPASPASPAGADPS